MSTAKNQVIELVITELVDKRDRYQGMIDSINESKRNETKSSAGDKFETGRAMMQAEEDKVSGQLAKIQQQIAIMQSISNIGGDKSIVELGALVETNTGTYFVSISHGKVLVDGEKVFAISPNSPVAQAMLGLGPSDTYSFNGRSFIIRNIY